MSEAVLDASVVVTWFDPPKRSSPDAELRTRYESGDLLVFVPSLLLVEVVNVAGRRWGWDTGQLLELAHLLQVAEFEIADPPLAAVAMWTGQGLTAYDATYVALAESCGVPFVTADRQVLRLAPGLAMSPADFVAAQEP